MTKMDSERIRSAYTSFMELTPREMHELFVLLAEDGIYVNISIACNKVTASPAYITTTEDGDLDSV